MSDASDLAKCLMELAAKMELWKPGAESASLELFWEVVPHYEDPIKGEGADICLYRAMDDRRIIGARLPFYPELTRVVVDGVLKGEIKK